MPYVLIFQGTCQIQLPWNACLELANTWFERDRSFFSVHTITTRQKLWFVSQPFYIYTLHTLYNSFWPYNSLSGFPSGSHISSLRSHSLPLPVAVTSHIHTYYNAAAKQWGQWWPNKRELSVNSHFKMSILKFYPKLWSVLIGHLMYSVDIINNVVFNPFHRDNAIGRRQQNVDNHLRDIVTKEFLVLLSDLIQWDYVRYSPCKCLSTETREAAV